MKFITALLGAIILCAPSFAQAPPLPTGTGGEVLQINPTIINPNIVGGASSGATNGIGSTVNTNAALQGSCTGFATLACPAGRFTYSSGVVRLGVNTLGDAEPLFFIPQNSACPTQFGDIGSCVTAADGKSFKAVWNAGNVVDLRNFGVVCDGATDNSASLQAAAKFSNVYLKLPIGTGTCKYSQTITIGNGTTAATSTVNNVFIGSDFVPAVWLSGFPQGLPTLEYTGSGAALNFQGQLSGWGLRGTHVVCDTASASGVAYVNGTGGDSYNDFIDGCKLPFAPSSLASAAPPTSNLDIIHNKFSHIVIQEPALTGSVGLNMSTPDDHGDVDFEQWNDVEIYFASLGVGTRTCIYWGKSDSVSNRDIHCITAGGGAGTIQGLVTDYSINTAFPNSNLLDHSDLGGSNPQYVVTGTPSTSAQANYVTNHILTNGSVYPINVAHLWPDITPWDTSTWGAPTLNCSTGTMTSSARISEFRQVRDTFEYHLVLGGLTSTACAGFVAATLWSATPCLQDAFGTPWITGVGGNSVSGLEIYGSIDPTASPQKVTMKTSAGAVPATTGDQIQVTGMCRYGGGP